MNSSNLWLIHLLTHWAFGRWERKGFNNGFANDDWFPPGPPFKQTRVLFKGVNHKTTVNFINLLKVHIVKSKCNLWNRPTHSFWRGRRLDKRCMIYQSFARAFNNTVPNNDESVVGRKVSVSGKCPVLSLLTVVIIDSLNRPLIRTFYHLNILLSILWIIQRCRNQFSARWILFRKHAKSKQNSASPSSFHTFIKLSLHQKACTMNIWVDCNRTLDKWHRLFL